MSGLAAANTLYRGLPLSFKKDLHSRQVCANTLLTQLAAANTGLTDSPRRY